MSLNGIGRLRAGQVPPRYPLGQPCGQAKCAYCGRYGPLGSCLGCGAPNKPVTPSLPARRPDVIEAINGGVLTPNEARAREGRPPIPTFDVVRQ